MHGPNLQLNHGVAARPSIEDVAADWLARRELGFSVAEQAEFSHWLLADRRHADAVARLERTWRFLRKPQLAGQVAAVEAAIVARLAARRRTRQRWWRALSVTGLAAAAAVAFWLQPLAPGDFSARAGMTELPVTVALKPELQTLPDGSVVELNAGAEIALDFTPGRRALRLVRGEAHFTVAKDASRPFLVTAGDVTVRAVGTAFNVRLDPAQVGVLVTEGRVAIDRTPASEAGGTALALSSSSLPAPAAPTYLGVGGEITVPTSAAAPAGLPEPRTLDADAMQSALAWRSQRVEFTDTPLAEVVALFNRHNDIQLSLAHPALGEVRISGVFWANAPEGFSRLLEASAGLRVERRSANEIVLHR